MLFRSRAEALERELKRRIAENPDMKLKDKMRLKRALFRVQSTGIRADGRINRVMEEMRNELLKTKLSEGEVKGILSRVDFITKDAPPGKRDSLIADARGHIEEFARMFNGKGLIEVDKNGDIGYRVSRVVIDPNERAYAQGSFIVTKGGKTVTFHEMGHIVDFGRGWMDSYAANWRD